MTEFKDDENNPVQTLKVEPSGVQRGGVYFHASRGYHAPSDQLLAILVEALEAAGVKPLPEEIAPRPDNADDLTGLALAVLKHAAAIRERQARPRVTEAQVEAVRLLAFRDYSRDLTELTQDVLQAALDSGVLVPADNKEGDRDE